MTFPSRARSFAFRPSLMLLFAGAFLTFSALVCFFAGNWHALPAAAKFALAGGGTALMLTLAPVLERKGLRAPASLALVFSALFTGLFWVVFEQTFQSGAAFRELCLAWAAGTMPLFLLRRTASLWNLLVVLLSVAVGPQALPDVLQDGYGACLLAPLLVAAACCVAALLPLPHLRRPGVRAAYLALPLTLLLAEATLLCACCILALSPRHQPSLPELVAGPLVLTAALAAALAVRHALTLCLLSLSGMVLLNAALLRLSDGLSPAETAVLFTLADGACAVLAASALPRLFVQKHHPRLHRTLARIPALFGGLLCALSLAVMTALLFTEKGSDAALLIAGLVYMPCGVLIWRRRGKSTFLSVLGSVLVSGGSFCFHIGLLDFSPAVLLASVWSAAVLLYVLIDYAPMRFFTALWALVSSVFFLPQLFDADLALPAFFLCLLPLFAASAGRFPRGLLRPAALASLLALLLISPSFPPMLPLRLPFFSVSEKIAITAAALNLAVLVWRHRPPRRLRPTEYAAAVLILTALWYLSPLENLVAFSMLLAAAPAGREAAQNAAPPDVALLLSGALVLVVSSLIFCFLPVFPFSLKMICLGIPGLCLLISGLWTERRNCAFVRRSAVPTAPPIRQAAPFALCALVLALMFALPAADRLTMLREGRTVLLRLRPQEREVFMLGDSMTLLYEADRELSPVIDGPGCLPLNVDENGTAEPAPEGFLKGADCAEVSGPALTVEQTAFGRMRLRLPRRWYFQDCLGIYYEDAAFAALLFDGKNRILLKGLADDKGRLIRPPRGIPTDEKSAFPSPKEDENAP